jgi:hypothetical protein
MRYEYFQKSEMIFEAKDQLPGYLPICGMASFKDSLTPIEIENYSEELVQPGKISVSENLRFFSQQKSDFFKINCPLHNIVHA